MLDEHKRWDSSSRPGTNTCLCVKRWCSWNQWIRGLVQCPSLYCLSSQHSGGGPQVKPSIVRDFKFFLSTTVLSAPVWKYIYGPKKMIVVVSINVTSHEKRTVTKLEFTYALTLACHAGQGPKLRPAGCQCDWKLSVGDQNFKASRQEATNFQRLVNVLNRRSRN